MFLAPISQFHLHHHYNMAPPTTIYTSPVVFRQRGQQQAILRSQTPNVKSQKYEEVSKQLDALYTKLDQMDQTINHLQKSYAFSPQKKITDQVVPGQFFFLKTASTRYQPYTPQKEIKNDFSDQKMNFENINEQISRIDLLKGKNFGEYIYFGELNQYSQREGYGTLYDHYGNNYLSIINQGRIIYTGLWLQDKYHNRGKLFFYDLQKNVISINNFDDQDVVDSNKVSYTGQFWQGQMKGLGQTLYSQKSGKERFIHYGKYDNGLFNGRGTIVVYYGDFESKNVKEMRGRWKIGRIV